MDRSGAKTNAQTFEAGFVMKKAQKTNKSAARLPRARDERGTNAPPTRRAFVPIVREFRAHTQKNQARLWIPIETNLIFRYEFAACSLQTRYIFVAIVLYCGGNGIDEIPLDAKFMASVLVADERTIQKSFDELLFKNLLVEKTERIERKEQTDRQETAGAGVSLSSENLSQTESENQSSLLKIVPATRQNGNSKNSQFTIEECLKYVEVCQSKGEAVQSPKALANHLHKTGEADALVMATLYPERAEAEEARAFGEPVQFTDEPCRVCFGAKMADAGGKGFRACEHCRNERGKQTGLEPKGETDDENAN